MVSSVSIHALRHAWDTLPIAADQWRRCSHRRDEPVLADLDDRRVDRAVLLPRPAGDDRRAGFEVGLPGRRESDDGRLRIDDDGLFAALVGDGELGAAGSVDPRLDIA